LVFESIADSSATPAAAADDFVANSKGAGAEPMLTIPMIGWVPKLAANRGKLASYSISKYGSQTGNDSQWFADAGNGLAAPTAIRRSPGTIRPMPILRPTQLFSARSCNT
jgi:hypothetical protein